MEEFKIKPLTVSERKVLENKERAELNEMLYKIGYNSAGCYVLTFPNGKKYIGRSDTLGRRLK